jgi:predicted nucleic acid-binding Zn ribbon protein
MSYVLQRNLRRSRKAHRIALALFFALLAVLLVSVYTGIRHLAIS